MAESAEQRKKREEAEEEDRRRRRRDEEYTAPIYPDPIGSYCPDTGSPPGGCGSDL